MGDLSLRFGPNLRGRAYRQRGHCDVTLGGWDHIGRGSHLARKARQRGVAYWGHLFPDGDGGAYVGALRRRGSQTTLLLLFATMMVVTAVAMFRGKGHLKAKRWMISPYRLHLLLVKVWWGL